MGNVFSSGQTDVRVLGQRDMRSFGEDYTSDRPQDENFELATETSESERTAESIAEIERESNRKSYDVLERSNSPEPRTCHILLIKRRVLIFC